MSIFIFNDTIFLQFFKIIIIWIEEWSSRGYALENLKSSGIKMMTSVLIVYQLCELKLGSHGYSHLLLFVTYASYMN